MRCRRHQPRCREPQRGTLTQHRSYRAYRIAINDALTALDDNDPRGAKSDLYHAQYLNLQIQKRLGKIGVAEDEDDEIQALRDQIERLQRRVVELEKLVKE